MKIAVCAKGTRRAGGSKRYRIVCRGEYDRGLVPQKHYAVDEHKNQFKRAKDAQRFWNDVIAPRITVGGISAEGKTFNDAYEAWLAHEIARGRDGDKFEATAHEDGNLVKNHVLDKMTLRGVPIGNVPLTSIDHALLRDELMNGGQLTSLTQLRTDKPLSRDTVKNVLQWIKKIFDIAVIEKWIVQNPASLLSIAEHRRDPLKDALDPKVYDKCARDLPQMCDALRIIEPTLVLPVQTMRWSGMRQSELRALSVHQLEATNQYGSVWVNQAWKGTNEFIGPVKGPRGRERSRYVPIELNEVQELYAHCMREGFRDNDLVFSRLDKFGARKQLDAATMRRAWHQAQFAIRGWGFFKSTNSRHTGRAYRLVELPKPIGEFTHDEWQSFKHGQDGLAKGQERDGLRFPTIEEAAAHIQLKLFGLHDLRHLYASELFAAGMELREVAKLLGDTEDTTQKYYVHYMRETAAQHLAVLSARRAAAGAR